MSQVPLYAAPARKPASLPLIAKQPASAPHMLRIVPHTVPCVSRSYEHFPDGFELHLLPHGADLRRAQKNILGSFIVVSFEWVGTLQRISNQKAATRILAMSRRQFLNGALNRFFRLLELLEQSFQGGRLVY